MGADAWVCLEVKAVRVVTGLIKSRGQQEATGVGVRYSTWEGSLG